MQPNARNYLCKVYNEVFKNLHPKVVQLVEQTIDSCKQKLKSEVKIEPDEFMMMSSENLRMFNDKV